MKQSLWKRFLSHLWEIEVENCSSSHNPELSVSLLRGRYQLCTSNAVYSHADLYKNFFQTFQRLDLNALEKGSRVLLLGMGLGSIPYMLEHNFKRSFHYTAVEIDEAVLYLVSKYVLPDLRSPVELICADAEAFVDVCRQSFDLICMDIFQDAAVPEVFEKTAFLERLKELLRPEGLLLYNRMSSTEEELRVTRRFYEDVFCKVFPEAVRLKVGGGNWMLLNKTDRLS